MPSDIAFCYDITASLAPRYLDDFEQLDLDWLKQLILNGHLYRIDYTGQNRNTGKRKTRPVGLLRLADIRPPVSVEIHFLLWPKYFRKAHEKTLFSDIIQFTFDAYPVRKIKAVCNSAQPVAIRLLQRLRFRLTGYSPFDTIVNGDWADTLHFELTRKQWEMKANR